MKLHDFLKVCNENDYVGIWDISGNPSKKYKNRLRFEERPTEQSYFKIGNIPYGRIMYLLDKEICGISYTKKGYLIKLHNAGEARKHLDMYRLADEIAKSIKREGRL